MNVKAKIWIEDGEQNLVFGEGKTQILEYINELGSISKAAKKANINYKKAWTHINTIENNISDNIVVRKKGGANGGGTTLTPKGVELIDKFNQFREEVRRFADDKFQELFLEQELIKLQERKA